MSLLAKVFVVYAKSSSSSNLLLLLLLSSPPLVRRIGAKRGTALCPDAFLHTVPTRNLKMQSHSQNQCMFLC